MEIKMPNFSFHKLIGKSYIGIFERPYLTFDKKFNMRSPFNIMFIV